MRENAVMAGATAQAMVSEFRNARFFGTSSPTMTEDR